MEGVVVLGVLESRAFLLATRLVFIRFHSLIHSTHDTVDHAVSRAVSPASAGHHCSLLILCPPPGGFPVCVYECSK